MNLFKKKEDQNSQKIRIRSILENFTSNKGYYFFLNQKLNELSLYKTKENTIFTRERITRDLKEMVKLLADYYIGLNSKEGKFTADFIFKKKSPIISYFEQACLSDLGKNVINEFNDFVEFKDQTLWWYITNRVSIADRLENLHTELFVNRSLSELQELMAKDLYLVQFKKFLSNPKISKQENQIRLINFLHNLGKILVTRENLNKCGILFWGHSWAGKSSFLDKLSKNVFGSEGCLGSTGNWERTRKLSIRNLIELKVFFWMYLTPKDKYSLELLNGLVIDISLKKKKLNSRLDSSTKIMLCELDSSPSEVFAGKEFLLKNFAIKYELFGIPKDGANISIIKNFIDNQNWVEGKDFEYFLFDELNKEFDELIFFSIFCYIKNNEKYKEKASGLDLGMMII